MHAALAFALVAVAEGALFAVVVVSGGAAARAPPSASAAPRPLRAGAARARRARPWCGSRRRFLGCTRSQVRSPEGPARNTGLMPSLYSDLDLEKLVTWKRTFWPGRAFETRKWNHNRYRAALVSGRIASSYSFSVICRAEPRLPPSNDASNCAARRTTYRERRTENVLFVSDGKGRQTEGSRPCVDRSASRSFTFPTMSGCRVGERRGRGGWGAPLRPLWRPRTPRPPCLSPSPGTPAGARAPWVRSSRAGARRTT